MQINKLTCKHALKLCYAMQSLIITMAGLALLEDIVNGRIKMEPVFRDRFLFGSMMTSLSTISDSQVLSSWKSVLNWVRL